MMTTISTTLGALVNAETSLAKVIGVKFDKDGGAKVRYHVMKLAKMVAAETKHFYDERNALVEKFGEGLPVSIAPTSKRWSEFDACRKAVAEIEITLSWGPITNAMIEAFPEITASDLIALGPLFQDSETT